MSFLLRRNLPLAWAGFFDSFARPPENPAKTPWSHIGDGIPADINNIEELHIPQNFGTTNGGGPSFEFQPFTPNYGIEFEIWFPVEGLAAQGFACYLTNSWAKKSGQFTDIVGVRLFHSPALGGDLVDVCEWPNAWAAGSINRRWNSPIGDYFGKTVTVRMWVEDDRWIRVWINNIYVGHVMIHDAYMTGPDRRAVRFLNNALCDVWMRWMDCYDRPPSVPADNTWTEVFYDDFNRPDGPVSNGWTQIGSDAELRSGSWSNIGGADNSVGLIRDTGSHNGRMRIRATVGGHRGSNNTADSSLILMSNSTGTQGLAANYFSSRLYIARFESALSDNQPAFTDYRDRQDSIAVNAGDIVDFSVHSNGIGWVSINGNRRLYIADINDVVPATNTFAGARVSRRSDTYSHSWNDIRIFK
ncbi:hypothetical protein IU451_29320 [Nocardia cyriacigeorgica]|uniref:hypothetical protein n=1 Tax=Nocardia cyriacigeorgica TaxID=135487 RepID=UPI001895A66E|nr:hypothetical protein [Nocardia cyriacigeorgica]MBF6326602.1 hypothetical protein [Nocardia cyriacigeorgica]